MPTGVEAPTLVAGRHGGDRAGHQDEGARRCRPRAFGRHVADHRGRRAEDRLGDLVHRGAETPRRVDRDEHGGGCPRRVLDRRRGGSRRRTGRRRPSSARRMHGVRRRLGGRCRSEDGQEGRATSTPPASVRAVLDLSITVGAPARMSFPVMRQPTPHGSTRSFSSTGRAVPYRAQPWEHREQGTRKLRGRRRRIPRGNRVHARHEGPLLPREEQQLMEGLLAGDDDRRPRPLRAVRTTRVHARLATARVPRGGRGAHPGRLPDGVAQGRAVRRHARPALDLAHDDRAQPRRGPSPPGDRRAPPDARAGGRGAGRAGRRRGGRGAGA